MANAASGSLAFGAPLHLLTADELAAGVADATQGRGVDIALELAGVAETVQACLTQTRIGGTVVLAGTVLPTPKVPLDPEAVVRRMLTIRGVHNYAPCDLATALDFFAGARGGATPFPGWSAAPLGSTTSSRRLRSHMQPRAAGWP